MIHGNLRDRLADAVGYVGRRVDDVFRRIALEKVLASTIEGRGGRETGQNIEVALKRKGVGAFRDSRGREWSLKNYAEMVARTTASEAASMGALNRLAENGVDLVRIVVAADACDVCKEHKDKVYSISGAHPRYPQLTEVPPFHPRCHCRVAGWVEGLSGDNSEESPKEVRERIRDRLRSGNDYIGRPGGRGRRAKHIRRVSMDEYEPESLFRELTEGGVEREGTSYPGTLIDLPAGAGNIGLRPPTEEKSYTMDVNIEGVRIREFKFLDPREME